MVISAIYRYEHVDSFSRLLDFVIISMMWYALFHNKNERRYLIYCTQRVSEITVKSQKIRKIRQQNNLNLYE